MMRVRCIDPSSLNWDDSFGSVLETLNSFSGNQSRYFHFLPESICAPGQVWRLPAMSRPQFLDSHRTDLIMLKPGLLHKHFEREKATLFRLLHLHCTFRKGMPRSMAQIR